MTHDEAANYSDNGTHNMTAEERAEGVEGVLPESVVLAHNLTNHSSNTNR